MAKKPAFAFGRALKAPFSMGTPALSMHKSTILSSSINSKIPSSKGVSILSLLIGASSIK